MKRFFKCTMLILITSLGLELYGLDAMITFFIRPYPEVKKSQSNSKSKLDTKKYSKKLKQPDYVYRKISKASYNARHEIPGVMSLYAGQAELSGPQGQITFPRQQQTPNMYILISNGIKPAYMIAPGTVHNWMLDNHHPAEMYFMQLKHDPTTTLYYYETTKVDLPQDNNIPLNTIIFIADPKNMYVPLGATIVDYSPNIILPTIYIKRGFCFVYNSLYTLAINQYFEPTKTSSKQEGATIAQIQQLT